MVHECLRENIGYVISSLGIFCWVLNIPEQSNTWYIHVNQWSVLLVIENPWQRGIWKEVLVHQKGQGTRKGTRNLWTLHMGAGMGHRACLTSWSSLSSSAYEPGLVLHPLLKLHSLPSWSHFKWANFIIRKLYLNKVVCFFLKHIVFRKRQS